MKGVALALTLAATPAGGDSLSTADGLYALYAGGQYEAAMHAGTVAGTAQGLAIAARAALADAAMKPAPCLECLQRAENYARRAVAANTRAADGHVWLAASLGLEARIGGVVQAKLADAPGKAKAELDAALKDEPRNPYALAALGGWNIEIVRAGGSHLGKWLYGADEREGLSLFDRAEAVTPRNVAVHYQYALALSGYAPTRFRARIESELSAAIHGTPETAYEKFIQGRAADLLALLKKNDSDGFDALVHKYQGYP